VRIKSSNGAFLSAFMIIAIAAFAIPLLSSSPVHATLTSHAPIYINGNDNFISANGVVGGSGTENDPYIIENWDINAENVHGTWIENTTAYFIIRNCYVHDGWNNGKFGIYLNSVINGKIDNCIIENNYDGIMFNHSSNNFINCAISNNALYGIYLSYSPNNCLKNNALLNNMCNLNVWGSENISCYYQDIDTSNEINGKPIYYMIEKENLVFDGENIGYLGLISCENILVNNLTMGEDTEGIYLFSTNCSTITNCITTNKYWEGILLISSSNNIIKNCATRNNYLYGFEIISSSNNTILNCNIENNLRGIYLYNYSDNNLVLNNTVENNYYGIYSYYKSDNNRIYHNIIINNATQAYDNCSNYWDNGYPSGGNYWSDYAGADNYRGENQDMLGSDGIGDTPCYIIGDNNRDRYPLMNPFGEQPIVLRAYPSGFENNTAGGIDGWISKPNVTGENWAMMVAKRIGSGAVAAAALCGDVQYYRVSGYSNGYTDNLDVLLDITFQWMKPGATKVLWFDGDNIYSPYKSTGANAKKLLDNLRVKGYSIYGDNRNLDVIDNLSLYDILVLPMIQLGNRTIGGDPSLLPDNWLNAVRNFVNSGKGALIMGNGDYLNYCYNRVSNKILDNLGFGWWFQNDSLYDNNQNYSNSPDNASKPYVVKVTGNPIGDNFAAQTGRENIGMYRPCTLIPEPTITATVNVPDAVGDQGTSVILSVTIRNKSTVWDNFSLSVSDSNAWGPTLSTTMIHLDPSASTTVDIAVNIPLGTWGQMDNVTVTATSFSGYDFTFSGAGRVMSGGAKPLGPHPGWWGWPNNTLWVAKLEIENNIDVGCFFGAKTGAEDTFYAPPPAFPPYIRMVFQQGGVDYDSITRAEPAAPQSYTWYVKMQYDSWGGDNVNAKIWAELENADTLFIPQDYSVILENQADGMGPWNLRKENGSITLVDGVKRYATLYMDNAVNVTVSQSSQTGGSDQNLVYTVTVQNTGRYDDNYSLSASDTKGWELNVSPSSLSVPAGTSGTATLTMNPSGMGPDPITVTADGSYASDYARFTAVPLSVTISPSLQHGWIGDNLFYSIVVKNLGVKDNFLLNLTEALGWPYGWNAPIDNAVKLDNGENWTGTVWVMVAGNLGDIDNLKVTATSYMDNTVTTSATCQAHASRILHNPIYINGNDNFTSSNGVTSGSGTENEPYIIENWDISAEDANGIEINNTTAYFVIRNCYVHGCRASGCNGIRFDNVINGNINNNLVDNNYGGISLSHSSSNVISNSIVENNDPYSYYALIYLGSSDNNIIENCIVKNGVRVGIQIDYSTNNKLKNNVISNNTFNLNIWGNEISHFYQDIDTSNKIDGKPAYYIIGQENLIFDGNFMDMGYLGLVSCERIMVRNLDMSNKGNGILLADTSNSVVTNSAFHNNWYAIDLWCSLNNTVINNTVENNDCGIGLTNSDNNYIYHNNLINNTAFDFGSNYWDDGYPSGGNYWSDYAGLDNYRGENQDIPGSDGIGDTPYNISGGNNKDRYPLMFPYSPTEVIVQGDNNAYNIDLMGDPTWRCYEAGDHPPIMAAKRVGSGAVIAAGTARTCNGGVTYPTLRWKLGEWDVLLGKAFQWMVPGATKVLWYGKYGVGYNVFNDAGCCSWLIDNLRAMGYTVDNTGVTPITSALLEPYDILVIPQLQLGGKSTGGDPSLLPDNDVQAIKSFVEGGGGLLIMEGSDFAGYNYYKVQNKILRSLDMGMYFQDDSINDNTNKENYPYWPIVQVNSTSEIGTAYRAATGKTTITLYAINSLAEPGQVIVLRVSPNYQEGSPGENFGYIVTVMNIGTEDDSYTLTVSDNAGWGPSLSENFLTIPSGENRTVTLYVTLPENTINCIEDNITVTATSLENMEVSENVSCIAYADGTPPTIENALAVPEMVALIENSGPSVAKLIVDAYDIGSGIRNVTLNFKPLFEQMFADVQFENLQAWQVLLENWENVSMVHENTFGVWYFDFSSWLPMGSLWRSGLIKENQEFWEIVSEKIRLGDFVVRASVEDLVGNVSATEIKLAIVDSMVPLYNGWNIRSTPIALENGSWGSVASLGDGLEFDAALRYDSENQSWGYVGANYSIKPLEGIYTHAVAKDQLGLIFKRGITSPPVRQLYSGWNLIGLSRMPWEPEMQVNEALISIEQASGGRGYTMVISPYQHLDYSSEFRYKDWSFGSYTWQFRQDPWTYTASGGNAPLMTNIGGYWVFMENPDTLAGFSYTPVPYELVVPGGIDNILMKIASIQTSEVPPLPALYYGSVNIVGNGETVNAPVGTVITALVGGEEKGRITVTATGKYDGPTGLDLKLVIQGDIQEGSPIEFYINGVRANENSTFESGKVKGLDLTVNLPAHAENILPGTTTVDAREETDTTINISTNQAGSVTVVKYENNPSGPPSSAFTVIGKYVDVSTDIPPENVSWPIEIRIYYNENEVVKAGVSESSLRIFYWNGNNWVQEPDSGVDIENNYVWARVTHLSVFTPMALPSIELSTGWNLVGFTVTNENNTPDNLFFGQTYYIWRWNAENKKYVSPLSTAPVELGVGYWIWGGYNQTVVTSGVPVDNYSINLKNGWNLVGFPVTSLNTTPYNILGNQTYYMWRWNAENKKYVSPSTIAPVELGVGYWIWVDHDQSVTVP